MPERRRRSDEASAPLRVLESQEAWLPTTESWLHRQLAHLPPDVEATVACRRLERPERFPVPRLRLHPAGRGGPGGRLAGLLVPWPRFLAREARRCGARILHSHFGHRGWRDAPVARRLGLRHVVSFYGHDLSLPGREAGWHERYRDLFARVDLVLAEGPFSRATLLGLGCPADRVAVHHLGVDLARLPFQPRAPRRDGPLRVLLVGRFVEKKGLPDGLAALRALGGRVPWTATVVGDTDGSPASLEEKRRILDAARAAGDAGPVRFTGALGPEALLSEAATHDLLLVPSRTAADGDSEGGAPVAMLEMAATGMPVVATRHCDIPMFVRHRETGLLAEPGDVEGLAEAVAWLHAHPEAWAPMARAARGLAEREFDARRQGAELARAYRQAADGLPPGGVG